MCLIITYELLINFLVLFLKRAPVGHSFVLPTGYSTVVYQQVTDTPGVCDTHRPLEEVHREICKSVATVIPGPHAVIMCLRCDRRFTDEEYQAYEQLKKLFGNGLKDYMILVFNGLDQVGTRPDFRKLGQKIKNLGLVLDDLVSDDRLIVFNNEASWESRKEQGDQLLDAVVGVFESNNRQYFTDDIMKKFEAAMEQKLAQGMTREEVQAAVINNDHSVTTVFEKQLPKEEVKKRGGGCTIL